MSHWIAYFIEKDPPVSFPVSGSRKESFRQHSVGRPTSYLMPTIFINSCSWTPQIKRRMIEINQFLIRRHHPHTLEPWGQCTAFHFLLINSVFFSLRESRRWHSKFFKLRKVMLQCCLACLFKRPKKKKELKETLHFTRRGQYIHKDAHCACNALQTAVCTEIAVFCLHT